MTILVRAQNTGYAVPIHPCTHLYLVSIGKRLHVGIVSPWYIHAYIYLIAIAGYRIPTSFGP